MFHSLISTEVPRPAGCRFKLQILDFSDLLTFSMQQLHSHHPPENFPKCILQNKYCDLKLGSFLRLSSSSATYRVLPSSRVWQNAHITSAHGFKIPIIILKARQKNLHHPCYLPAHLFMVPPSRINFTMGYTWNYFERELPWYVLFQFICTCFALLLWNLVFWANIDCFLIALNYIRWTIVKVLDPVHSTCLPCFAISFLDLLDFDLERDCGGWHVVGCQPGQWGLALLFKVWSKAAKYSLCISQLWVRPNKTFTWKSLRAHFCWWKWWWFCIACTKELRQ